MAKLRLVHPFPALTIEADQKYLVVSDLHIGFESQLVAKGINISSISSVDEMLGELSTMVQNEKPDAVVLLGDIKSSIGKITRSEWDAIPRFLQKLSKIIPVYLIPGNHDGDIRHLVPRKVRMISSTGMVIEDTLLTHGHTLPGKQGTSINRIVMGHIHPVFLREGSSASGQRVWFYLKTRKGKIFPGNEGTIDIIVMPTFNKYFYYSIYRINVRKAISPIVKRAENAIQEAMVLALDGSILGDESLLRQII